MVRRRRAGQAGRTGLAAALGLVVAAASFAGLAQPQLVVGDPLPQVATARYLPKPPPPKALLARTGLLDKPTALDLGAEPAPVSVPDGEDPLVRSLGLRLQQAVLAAGDIGTSAVHVMDADGRVLFDLGGTRPLIPASTAKLVTAAAALTAFGPDHRFTTRVVAAGPPGPDGVVPGDLVLVGGGDPTLVSRTFVDLGIDPDRPQTTLDGLAQQLAADGITRIEGAVLGDDGFLEGPDIPEGWPPAYLEDLDGTRATGLSLDAGLTFVEEGGRLVARASGDPAADAAAALTAALTDVGITVGAPPRALDGVRPTASTVLASLDSPSVEVLLRHVMQDSDNHIADTLLRAVGRRVEGSGSFLDGAAMAERVLAGLRLDWSTTVLQDGSGLSRATTIPPALLTTLNYRMTRSPIGAEWQELMAVSGASGTLRSRLTDSIAELRLRGKTGSLGDVRALSGAVVGPDGRPLYFTVISNDLTGPQLPNARRLQDLVVLALAAELYGCTELPPPPPPAQAPEEPPPAASPEVLPPLPQHTCTG